MSRLCTILFLLLTQVANAQQIPAVLSIEGMGGNVYDQVSPRVVQTGDGGFILSISTNSTGGPILCDTNHTSSIFIKYNADATMLEWKRCFNNAYYYLFPTPDGNYVVANTRQTNNDGWQFFIGKIDDTDASIWQHYYGGSGGELLKDIIATEDGSYVMLGISNSNDGDVGMHYGGQFNDDIWVLKVDSNGNKVWSTVLGGTQDERAYALAIAPENGVYVAGATYSTDNDCMDNHGGEDAFVARLDDSGHVLWHRCIGGSAADGNEMGWAVPNGRGGLLMVSTSFSSDGDIHNHFGGADMWAFDIDSSSNLLWNKSYGGTSNEYAYCITRATDGTIWMGAGTISNDGQVYMSYGGGDVWIAHTDSIGNLLSSKVLGESNEEEPAILCSLPGGIVLTCGTYWGGGPVGGEFPSQFYGGTDVFLARFAPWMTGVNQLTGNRGAMIVYPNPASEEVKVMLSGEDEENLVISDILGRIVYRANISQNKTLNIDVKDWQRGIYCLHSRNKQGYSEVQTLIVQ